MTSKFHFRSSSSKLWISAGIADAIILLSLILLALLLLLELLFVFITELVDVVYEMLLLLEATS